MKPRLFIVQLCIN